MTGIEIYKTRSRMYDIMKTLTRLQYSDYEDEQKGNYFNIRWQHTARGLPYYQE